MADTRPRRLAAVSEALAAAHLDGVLLTGLPNIRYLTGFSGTSALVIVAPDDLLLVTDFRYATQVHDEVGDLARIVIEPQSLWSGLWRTLPSFTKLEVLGFESAHLLHRDFARLLDAGNRWQWRATTDLVEALRERKDEGEVALIASAADVATRALERTVPELGAGMSELKVAGILEQALREEGSEGLPFPTIVASGPRTALPHARTSSRVLERGDLLLIDFGAIVEGYCADVTRTFVVGPPSDDQRDVHAAVREANELAAGAVHAGMRGKDADAVARRYIEGRGYGEEFGHSLGHGIGLEIHEAPRLASTAEAVLQRGSVVTIEPGVYRAGWGGVRVEDDAVLMNDGARILTTFTRELIELA